MSLRHSLLAVLVVVIWGGNFVVIDAGQQDVPPLLFLALRFLVVCVPAVFLLKPPGIGWRQLLVVGGFLSLGQFALLYLALALGMPPGLASLLLQTQVMFSLVVAAIVVRERPTRRQLAGVGLGMVGLALVIAGHSLASPLVPLVLTLAAALSWSIGNVLARRAQARSGLSLVVWSGLVVPLPALALSLVVDTPHVVWHALTNLSWIAIASTVYTAIFASLIGYGIWNSLLARYSTSAVVPFTLLVPVVGMVTAWLVQGEVPTVSELVGGSIVLAGLAVAVLQPRRARVAMKTPIEGSKENLT